MRNSLNGSANGGSAGNISTFITKNVDSGKIELKSYAHIFDSSEKTKVKAQGNNFKQITLLKCHPKPCFGSFVYRNTGKGLKVLLCAILASSNN